MVLPQVVIASTLRYQGFGADVMRVLATTTDIAWDEERTLPQWAGILDVLNPRVLAALDTALASRPGNIGGGALGGSQRLHQQYQAPRDPPSTDRTREACRNFAAGRCTFGDHCLRSHASVPTTQSHDAGSAAAAPTLATGSLMAGLPSNAVGQPPRPPTSSTSTAAGAERYGSAAAAVSSWRRSSADATTATYVR